MSRLIFILQGLVLAFSLKAQEIFVTVAPKNPVVVAEQFQVLYTADEDAKISNFTSASFEDFQIITGPNIYTTSVIKENKVKHQRNWVYTLLAIRPGRFVLEGGKLIVNGKQFRSNDVIVEVISKKEASRRFNKEKQTVVSDYFLAAGEDPYQKIRKNLFVKMSVNKKSCFVGEPVIAVFKLYSRLESRSDITKNPGFYGFTVYDMINLDDKEVATEFVQGRQFDVHTIRKVQLYPLREGTFAIDPMEVKNSVEFSRSVVNKKTEQEIVEGILKNNSNEVKDSGSEIFETTISTEPVAITVKPYPVRSVPPAFNGATGIFNISATVSKNTLAKNEEGSLEITISGKGNFIQINAPAIDWPNGIEGFDPVVNDILDKTKTPLSGSRTFHYAFISADPGNYTIPSTRFSFFNPDSGKYRIVGSSGIKLTITNEKSTQTSYPGVINKSSFPWGKYLFIGAVGLLLAATVLYFSLMKRDNKRDSEKSETNQPPISLSIDEFFPLSLLSQPGDGRNFCNSLRLSMWKLFNYYFNLSGSEMTKRNLAEKLKEKNINERLIENSLKILQECEAGIFTNTGLMINRDELLQRARNLFVEISIALSSGKDPTKENYSEYL